MSATPWSAGKAETFEKLLSLWTERRAADAERAAVAGGLQWKFVGGREYLIHHHYDETTGQRRFNSKGRRSPETEAWIEEFHDRRERCRAAVEHLDEQQLIQAAVAKTIKLGRAPAVVGGILRALADSAIASRVTLAGSFAILAHETQAHASVPADALNAPNGKPDLDLFVEDDSVLHPLGVLLRSVDFEIRPPGLRRPSIQQ